MGLGACAGLRPEQRYSRMLILHDKITLNGWDRVRTAFVWLCSFRIYIKEASLNFWHCFLYRLWPQSWPRLVTTPRRLRTTCCTQRTCAPAETNTKLSGRSARATLNRGLMSLRPYKISGPGNFGREGKKESQSLCPFSFCPIWVVNARGTTCVQNYIRCTRIHT